MLSAVDISATPIAALEEFLTAHAYDRNVRTHYSVDQSDPDAITRILSDDFGDAQVDLILDDASHDYDLTRASFGILFDRLRPGGLYIIEDWAWGLFPFAERKPRASLAPLVFELMMTLPWAQTMIESISIDRFSTIVRKGTVDPSGAFELSDCYGEKAASLVEGLTTAFEAP